MYHLETRTSKESDQWDVVIDMKKSRSKKHPRIFMNLDEVTAFVKTVTPALTEDMYRVVDMETTSD